MNEQVLKKAIALKEEIEKWEKRKSSLNIAMDVKSGYTVNIHLLGSDIPICSDYMNEKLGPCISKFIESKLAEHKKAFAELKEKE